MSVGAAISAGLASMSRQEARVEAVARNIAGAGVPATMDMVGIAGYARPNLVGEASAALVGNPIDDMIDLIVAKRGYQANVSSFTVLQDMARESARIVEERSKR